MSSSGGGSEDLEVSQLIVHSVVASLRGFALDFNFAGSINDSGHIFPGSLVASHKLLGLFVLKLIAVGELLEHVLKRVVATSSRPDPSGNLLTQEVARFGVHVVGVVVSGEVRNGAHFHELGLSVISALLEDGADLFGVVSFAGVEALLQTSLSGFEAGEHVSVRPLDGGTVLSAFPDALAVMDSWLAVESETVEPGDRAVSTASSVSAVTVTASVIVVIVVVVIIVVMAALVGSDVNVDVLSFVILMGVSMVVLDDSIIVILFVMAHVGVVIAISVSVVVGIGVAVTVTGLHAGGKDY